MRDWTKPASGRVVCLAASTCVCKIEVLHASSALCEVRAASRDVESARRQVDSTGGTGQAATVGIRWIDENRFAFRILVGRFAGQVCQGIRSDSWVEVREKRLRCLQLARISRGTV